MIKFENISVTYPGGVEALKDLDLEINEGDFIIIVGLSGAGKSTLLRTINNLVKPTKGIVYLENKNVTNASKRDLKKIRSEIGMIFQTFNLVNRSTVLKNVLTGRLSNISTFRYFGPLKIKWSSWRNINGSYITPVTHENGKILFLAVNCNSSKINLSKRNGNWNKWLPPQKYFEYNLLEERCNNAS